MNMIKYLDVFTERLLFETPRIIMVFGLSPRNFGKTIWS